jgi:hypothetical protein
MNKPAFITFTGVDEWTSQAGMLHLSSSYPIEWGILFSPDRQGIEARYPPIDFIEAVVTTRMQFAAHLCGRDARSVIDEGESPHDPLIADFFDRCQINTSDAAVPLTQIARWARSVRARAILQCRNATSFFDVEVADILFDASGGRGISPAAWPPAKTHKLCGYAGGLGPANAREAVNLIGEMASVYWIDMESGVRDAHDRFSLSKCEEVCRQIYGEPLDMPATT